MIKIGIIGHGRAREFLEMFRAIESAPQKCSECVAYHAEGNMSVPCKGDFLEHCEYNGTEEEEEGEQERVRIRHIAITSSARTKNARDIRAT